MGLRGGQGGMGTSRRCAGAGVPALTPTSPQQMSSTGVSGAESRTPKQLPAQGQGAGSCHHGRPAGTPARPLPQGAPQFPTFPPARHPSYFAFLPLSYLPAGSPLCSWALVFSLPSPWLPGPTCCSSPLKDPEAGP